MGKGRIDKLLSVLDKEFEEEHKSLLNDVEAFRVLYYRYRKIVEMLDQWEKLCAVRDSRNALIMGDQIRKEMHILNDCVQKERKWMAREIRQLDFIDRVTERISNEMEAILRKVKRDV